MKCAKTGMYTILMDGKHWCAGCRDYHELNTSADMITDRPRSRRSPYTVIAQCWTDIVSLKEKLD